MIIPDEQLEQIRQSMFKALDNKEFPLDKKDIAKVIGVSPNTVNKFLHHPEIPLHEFTKWRLMKWFDEESLALARSLKLKRSKKCTCASNTVTVSSVNDSERENG